MKVIHKNNSTLIMIRKVT